MQKRLTATHFFDAAGSLARSTSGTKASNTLTGKIRQMAKWLDPKNWFSSLANIEITLEEFACKKFVPEEKITVQSEDKEPQLAE
jgi:hypothetical protein